MCLFCAAVCLVAQLAIATQTIQAGVDEYCEEAESGHAVNEQSRQASRVCRGDCGLTADWHSRQGQRSAEAFQPWQAVAGAPPDQMLCVCVCVCVCCAAGVTKSNENVTKSA